MKTSNLLKIILKKILFDYCYPLKKRVFALLILPLRRRFHVPYDSTEFKIGLQKVGIQPGDALFVMCSADKIYQKTGHHLPVHLVLRDLLEFVGKEGTIMVLGYADKRVDILSKKRIFNVRKTPTQNGILSELLRRKSATIRSLHPVYSALAYGRKAKDYCSYHHLSPYAFDEHSPYYRITQDGGKYLGIGLGVEAFSPGHMLDDYYKQSFKHPVYAELQEYKVVGYQNEDLIVKNFVRRNIRGFEAPRYHFKLLKVASSQHISENGILLFSMNMDDYLQASIDLYDRKTITIWSIGLPSWLDKIGRFYQQIRYFI